jgi:membrane dipeptidase
VAQGDFMQAHVATLAIDCVLDHIVHAVEICGVEHVGIGSDFDGIQRRPVGLEDVSCYGNLARGLRARGFEPGEIEALLGGNMERVFARVTAAGTKAGQAVVEAT